MCDVVAAANKLSLQKVCCARAIQLDKQDPDRLRLAKIDAPYWWTATDKVVRDKLLLIPR